MKRVTNIILILISSSILIEFSISIQALALSEGNIIEISSSKKTMIINYGQYDGIKYKEEAQIFYRSEKDYKKNNIEDLLFWGVGKVAKVYPTTSIWYFTEINDDQILRNTKTHFISYGPEKGDKVVLFDYNKFKRSKGKVDYLTKKIILPSDTPNKEYTIKDFQDRENRDQPDSIIKNQDDYWSDYDHRTSILADNNLENSFQRQFTLNTFANWKKVSTQEFNYKGKLIAVKEFDTSDRETKTNSDNVRVMDKKIKEWQHQSLIDNYLSHDQKWFLTPGAFHKELLKEVSSSSRSNLREKKEDILNKERKKQQKQLDIKEKVKDFTAVINSNKDIDSKEITAINNESKKKVTKDDEIEWLENVNAEYSKDYIINTQ
ncbi:MAG: hypothetical protein HQK49_15995 [Oligoflexia bacterium]|nr:hypothetical protein [Oligoflexia bacterium]